MSYLFRSTGSVVGITTSQCLLQNLLKKWLTERIRGPNAENVCLSIYGVLIIDHNESTGVCGHDI